MTILMDKVACVFGGTGFIGTQIVRELAQQGYRVKVATRVPERAFFLRPCGVVGQVVPCAFDYSAESISECIEGCEIVVNAVGILFEKGRSRFSKVHVDLARTIAENCAQHNVKYFVHLSALGIEQSRSRYAQSKREGEKAVHEAYPNATILRPSVVFGPGDSFFNMFASLAQIAPALPLIGGGKTRFQPVYVGDVADAVMTAIAPPAIDIQDAKGQIILLGGPEILSLKDIYHRLFQEIKTKRMLLTLPFPVAKIKAAFLGLLPKPPLTIDQVESLKSDSVVDIERGDGRLDLSDLGIEPTGMSTILPTYLARFQPGGRFADKKAA